MGDDFVSINSSPEAVRAMALRLEAEADGFKLRAAGYAGREKELANSGTFGTDRIGSAFNYPDTSALFTNVGQHLPEAVSRLGTACQEAMTMYESTEQKNAGSIKGIET